MPKTHDDDKAPEDAAPAAPEEAQTAPEPSAAPNEPAAVVNPDSPDNPLNQNGYVGTDPIYQNRANETDQPL